MAKDISILVVDDAEINRQILSTLLDREYEIYEASDGLEALKVVESTPIDIIILDLIMPNMNGIEFLQIIKADDRFKHISVIVSSVAGSAENELQVLSLGADNFITKPYNPKLILHRVNSIVKTYIETRREHMRETEEMNERLFAFMEYIPGGFCVIQKTDKFRIQFSNTKLAGMLGYTPIEGKKMRGMDIFDFVDCSEENVTASFEKADKLNIVERDTVLVKKNGSKVKMALEIKADHEIPGNKQYLLTFSPIDNESKSEKLKQEIKAYKKKANLDSLSGLYNKEAFFRETTKIIKDNPNESFVIGSWNIDRFKVINEVYGRSAGDGVIRDFGAFLRDFFTGIGTVGRLDGDNFATCCSRDFLDSHADEIEALLLGKINWNHVNYPIQMHVGFYPADNLNEEVMLMCDRAGMALIPIKESYIRRSAYFSDEMKEAYVKEQKMMRDAEEAIKKHEFYVVYQPIINVKTKKIVSAEALVRWKKKSGEIVSPGDFIPVFEKNGFVARLDMYVAEEVLKFQRKRKEQNKSMVPVSINLSRVDFYNSNLSRDILALIKEYELNTDCLKLEVTESAYMDYPQALMDTIEEFQNAGFKVLMDDFGSGFSSLNMLKDVNADILKIDMRFMDNLETSDKAGSILYSIIQMAKSIKMEVVAEGVETANQYDLLFSMDCDSIQGYYFYRPLQDEEFAMRLDEDEAVKPVKDNRVHNSVLVFANDKNEYAEFDGIVSSICNVRYADDMEEFMKVLCKDCLNLDFAFIDMSGRMESAIELLSKIKSKAYLSDFPIVFIGAEGEMNYLAEVLNLGAFDALVKPIDWNLMYHRLRKHFREQIRSSVRDEYNTSGRNRNLRRRMEYSAAISNVGLLKLFLRNEDDFPIKNLVYMNDRFLYLHQLMEEEARVKKSLKEILNCVMPMGLSHFITDLKSAVSTRQTVLQHEYFIRWENKLSKKILVNCTLQYHGDEIYIDIVEIENFSSTEFKMDRFIQSVYKQISIGSDVKLWRYFPDRDLLEYYRRGHDGSYGSSLIEHGSDYVINYPFFDKTDKERVRSMIERILTGEDDIVEDFVMDSLDGGEKKRYIRVTCMHIDAMEESGDMLVGISRDITNDMLIKNQNWNELQYWKRMARGAALFLEADVNENRIISENTKEMLERMGLERSLPLTSLIEHFLNTVKDDERERIAEILSRKNLVDTYKAGEYTIKFDFLADLYGTGTYIWYDSDIFIFENENNSHIYISWQVTNVQRSVQTESVVKRMAGQDQLTGLCNRIMLETAMDTMLPSENSEEPPVFIVMDLDDFKQVNDCFGHDFGDDVLRAVSNVIRQSFSENDIVARLNSDEFAVFIPRCADKEKIKEIAADIIESAKIKLDDGEKSITIGCSMGILFAENMNDFKESFSLAGMALSEAKENGKNQYVIFSS